MVLVHVAFSEQTGMVSLHSSVSEKSYVQVHAKIHDHYTGCLRKASPNKLNLPKQMGEDQLDDLELDWLITLRILHGI